MIESKLYMIKYYAYKFITPNGASQGKVLLK